PNVDGVPVAKRFLFRLHFSQGNDAVDFLCAGGALPDDIFHRAHARDYLTRRKFLRILAESSCSYSDVELAFHSLRAALPQKDRVAAEIWGAHASRVLVAVSRRNNLSSKYRRAAGAWGLGKAAMAGTPPPTRETCVLPRSYAETFRVMAWHCRLVRCALANSFQRT